MVRVTMKMWWLILMVIFMAWNTGWKKKNRIRKCIVIKEVMGNRSLSGPKPDYSYSSDQLRAINNQMVTQQHRRPTPNYEALRTIKSLRINRKRIRLQKTKIHQLRYANINNLQAVVMQESDTESEFLSKNLRIATVNARSVRNKITEIQLFILQNSIDILVVTETWLESSEDQEAWITAQGWKQLGLQFDSVPRETGKKGGGVMLLVRENIEFKRVGSPQSETYEAQLWQLKLYNKEIYLAGVYHPPSSSKDQVSDSIFIDKFLDWAQYLIGNHSNIIILGDFNIHVNDFTNADAIIFNDAMSSLGLKQHVSSATHKTGNTLDLVFTEETADCVNIEKCQTYDFLSDHRWIVCELKVIRKSLKKKSIISRKLREDTAEILEKELDLAKIINEEDPIESFNNYHMELSRIYDLIAPEKKIKISERKRMPWYTSDIQSQKRIVRTAEKKWLKYHEDHQWKSYKRERNRYRSMLNYEKRNFYSGEILKVKGDVKKLYRLSNELIGVYKQNPMPDHQDDQQLADEFADFFLQKIVKIRDLFTHIEEYDTTSDLRIPQFTKFASLTEKEVSELMSEMQTKSCELDPIPTKILKQYQHKFLPIICKIVNLSLGNAIFHEGWKCAIVRPLLKKLGLELINKNYRPVSNLSFISKLIEKAALKQFLDHCNDNSLLPDYQSAYRKGFSCETSVIKLVNDILWSMENQHIMACAFLDLSAAFDTVDHQILLRVLTDRYGITGSALQWYDCYLRPRSFKVSVNNKYSSEKDLAFSVPQGSASGANIFTAYCASYSEVIAPPLKLQGFADDHFVRHDFKAGDIQAENKTISLLQKAMSDTKNWMDAMRLKLNTDKTEFIMFGNKTQLLKTSTSKLDVNNDMIEKSPLVKCLGAWLDENMTFTSHVNRKARTAMLNFRHIRTIRKNLTADACETLCLSLVMSHLDYCNSILLGLPSRTLKPFERIQAMCAKLVLNLKKSDSTTLAYRRLNWLPIKSRIEYKCLTLIHKSLFGISPEYLKNLFVLLPTPRRTLRSSADIVNKLLIPSTKLKTFAARSISVKGPELWNKLPRNMRECADLNSFKIQLKSHLITKYLY